MLTPMQSKLLEMLKWFHAFCAQHNITYYAMGGTMIGAARHKGFIPWDDDIDVGIPRTHYQRLLTLFRSPVDGYFLESPYSGNSDFLYSYAKLYDTNTTLTERLKIPCKRGVYIDVFPLDGIGDSLQEARKNFSKVDRKNMFLMMRTCAIEKRRTWYKNLSIALVGLLPRRLIDDKQLSMQVDQLARQIDFDTSAYVANLMGSYRQKEIIKREYFGTPTLYPFESAQIYGPEKYDEYLTSIYGDWRKLPPENQRVTAHHFLELDLERPYLH